MAQDIGTMRIRVEADTTDAEQGLKRTTSELSKMQVQAVRARRKAARASTVAQMGALAASGVGIGVTIARHRRRAASVASMAAGAAARTGAKMASRGAFGAAGGSAAAALGSVTGVLGIVGAISGVIIAVRGLRSVAESLLEETKKQTTSVGELVRTSLEQNRAPGVVEARRFAASDPFARGFAFNQARMRQLGIQSTYLQRAQFAGLADTERELTAMREARGRFVGGLAAPYKQMGLNIEKFLVRGQLGIGRHVTEPTQLGMALRASLMGMPVLNALVATDTATRFGFMAPDGEGLQEGVTQRMRSIQRQRDLLRLQTRGPGAVMTPAPTLRAGTEGEYAMRVQMQRQELALRQTVEWQNKVLSLLEQMVAADELTPEELVRQQIKFGREPNTTNIEGVD